MAHVKLDTGFNIEVDFEVAPFHKRIIGWFIDLFVCWIYVAIMSYILGTSSWFVFTNPWELKGLLIGLPVLFYHLILELSTNGRSVGKLTMNLKVITADGGQPGIAQFLIRWVFRLIDFPYWVPFAVAYGTLPWWTMPLTFAGVISIIFTSKSQRIGDVLAGTILIDLKSKASWEDTVFTELDADYQPLYPQVMQLSDRDINTLKAIIERVRTKDDYELARKIASRIKSKLNIDYKGQDDQFLVILLKDYNYYSGN